MCSQISSIHNQLISDWLIWSRLARTSPIRPQLIRLSLIRTRWFWSFSRFELVRRPGTAARTSINIIIIKPSSFCCAPPVSKSVHGKQISVSFSPSETGSWKKIRGRKAASSRPSIWHDGAIYDSSALKNTHFGRNGIDSNWNRERSITPLLRMRYLCKTLSAILKGSLIWTVFWSTPIIN